MKMSQRLGNSQRTSWSLELLELWVPTFHLRPTRTPSRLFSPCPPENARTSQSKTLQWLSPSSNWSCSNGVLHLLHIWVDLLELQSRLNEVVATWDAENVDFHDMFFFSLPWILGHNLSPGHRSSLRWCHDLRWKFSCSTFSTTRPMLLSSGRLEIGRVEVSRNHRFNQKISNMTNKWDQQVLPTDFRNLWSPCRLDSEEKCYSSTSKSWRYEGRVSSFG